MARTNKSSRRRPIERAPLEQRLADLQAQLAQQTDLLNLAHDSLIVMDLHYAITFWNRGAELRYGWRQEEARGQVLHTLLRTEFLTPLEELQAALERVGCWEGELVHYTRSGVRRAVTSRWRLFRNALATPPASLRSIAKRPSPKTVQTRTRAYRIA